MGRKKSNYTCPKCKRHGYLTWKPTWNGKYPNSAASRYPYVIHYDHETKSRKECSVNGFLRKEEISRFKSQENGEVIYTLTQDCRRISVYFLRMMRMLNKKYEHVKIDNKDFILLAKSTRLVLLWVTLLAKDRKIQEYKQILGEGDKDIVDLETTINKIRLTLEKDLVVISSLVSNQDLVLKSEQVAISHYRLYHKLKGKNREFIVERAGNLLYALKYAPAFLMPLLIALEDWTVKYKFPEMIKSKEILRKEQSEAAFGSGKYSGVINE